MLEPEEIRDLLNKLPAVRFTRKPLRHKAILCSAVAHAGVNVEEVERWVKEHGGEKRSVNPRRKRRFIMAGRKLERIAPISYFVIPLDALK